MTKRYALKGVNEDESVCSVCGKVELKRVMWLVELDADGGEISEAFAVGTSCGAKMLGYSAGKVAKAADDFASKLSYRRLIVANNYAEKAGKGAILTELNRLGLSFKERISHPLWAEMKRIEAEATAQAEADVTHIEF